MARWTRHGWTGPAPAGGIKTLVCFSVAAGLAVAIAPSGCNKPAGPTQDAASLGGGDEGHGLHTVHNQKLAFIMNELRGLDFDRMARQAADGRADRRMADAARHAADLAADARLLPVLYKSETFNDEHQRVFDQLSARLRVQCLELRDAASAGDAAKARARLEQVIRTCNECHASFRGPSMAWSGIEDVPY